MQLGEVLKQFKRIYVEITNVCNLSCSFCPPLQRQPKYMNVEEFERILQQITPYTDYIYFHIKGEPLLHPELAAFLELCYDYQLKVNITTNGTLLEKMKPLLYEAKALRQINISLHSFEQAENFEGYLKEILSVAKHLRDNTNTITALRLWNLDKQDLTSSNLKQNYYVLQSLEDAFPLDFSLIKLMEGSSYEKDSPQWNQTKGIKLSERIYLNQDYQFVWPSLNAPYIGENGSCYGLRNQLGILVDGTVVPCCLDGDGVVSLGNILTKDLKDILLSSRVQAITDGFSTGKVVEDLCKHCGYRTRFL